MAKSVVELKLEELPNITGASNECGCSNGIQVHLCNAPDEPSCLHLCCEIKGYQTFQWLNKSPERCAESTFIKYNPFILMAGLVLGVGSWVTDVNQHAKMQ